MDVLGAPPIPPFGVSPFGAFLPGQIPAKPTPPPGILAERIDYGNPDPSRDPRAATFEVLSLTRGMHPIDEQVCIAISRVQGSGSAVDAEGHTFFDVSKLTADAPALLMSKARNALKRLVNNADIEVLSLSIETIEDQANIALAYRNLRSTDKRVRGFRPRFQAAVGVEVVR